MTPRDLLDCIRAMSEAEKQGLADLIGDLPIPRLVMSSGSVAELVETRPMTAEDCASFVCTTDDAGRDD